MSAALSAGWFAAGAFFAFSIIIAVFGTSPRVRIFARCMALGCLAVMAVWIGAQ